MKLDAPVNKLPLVGPIYAKRLKKLDIVTVENLLHHVPHRYNDYRSISKISDVQIGKTVTIRGRVESVRNVYTKSQKKIQLAKIVDDTGSIDVIWFNQPFIARNIKTGERISLSAKVNWYNRKPALISPEYEIIRNTECLHTGRIVPVYPTTAKISSKWLRGKISYAIKASDTWLDEFLPNDILDKHKMISFKDAIGNIHFPKSISEAKEARRRLAFNELLSIQIKKLYRKSDWNKNVAVHKLTLGGKVYREFSQSLPFSLTKSQVQSIKEVLSDLKRETPMNRLLEGDVGSGKTIVAAAAAFASFVNGHQSVFMAPTQILAQQHFDSLKDIFNKFKVRVSLITSAGVKADLGKTDIFVGTHALIHKKVNFDNVALVVIDEQQRFGVEQRAHLVKKSGKKSVSPHVLTMTATPIPRTIALTYYGDLDLSTLDELPKGRKPITTWLVPPSKRKGAYGWIKKQIEKDGVQAFIICPLIEESEVETMNQIRAATQEFTNLQKIFPKFTLGLLHGKQKAKEKDNIMDKFKKGKIDILVSTPVVEVGIDIPNATIMLIEGADRFGLAQLHQLRGRIGRGEKKSYCLLFTESRGKKAQTRLDVLKKTMCGFELAELDLKLRGPGEISGTRQHGFPELKIATWQDANLIRKSKQVAQEAIVAKKKYSKLLKKLQKGSIIYN
jgi:ATP-dependent DNA helicase RecG